MGYKFDYLDGDVLQWSLTESGAEYAVDESYTPTIYVSAHRGARSRPHAPRFVTTPPSLTSASSKSE